MLLKFKKQMQKNTIIEKMEQISERYYLAKSGVIMKLEGSNWGNILSQHKNSDGYPVTIISERGKRRTILIHRKLAELFIPNPEGKKFVEHINGIKSDNRLENLRWATGSEIKARQRRNGLKSPRRGGIALKDVVTGEVYMSKKEACKKLQISMRALNKHLRSRQANLMRVQIISAN
jgi:hypothetical protein